MIPYTPEAYQLLHEGARALAVVECNGMRVDVDYLHHAIRRTTKRVAAMQEELQKSEVWKVWKGVYGAKANIGSDEQLGKILFGKMGFTSPERTATGRYKADVEALEAIDDPFVKGLGRMRVLQKAISTNLKGLLREVVDGYVHPFYNLHVAKTYRSSCDSPNQQNVPVRNKEIMKLVRRAYIARRGRQIVELDFKGAEVLCAACYHKDPAMISYICDPTKDLHRDMAMEIYQLPKDEVGKDIRYCGKGMFVFAQFYGDYYIDCAQSLWGAVGKMGLKTVSGVPLKKHLKSVGLVKLGLCDPKQDPVPGTFEDHIQKVERRFWEKRFPVYAQWKKDWYEQYRKRGWLKTLTGFVCQGYMKRNEAINYPVQGSAFHWLLWALTRLVLKELRRHKMRALIVGQIHDSMLGDVPVRELKDYLELCQDVLTRLLPQHWPWIIAPVQVEVEVAPVGGSWADKAEYKG